MYNPDVTGLPKPVEIGNQNDTKTETKKTNPQDDNISKATNGSFSQPHTPTKQLTSAMHLQGSPARTSPKSSTIVEDE